MAPLPSVFPVKAGIEGGNTGSNNVDMEEVKWLGTAGGVGGMSVVGIFYYNAVPLCSQKSITAFIHSAGRK